MNRSFESTKSVIILFVGVDTLAFCHAILTESRLGHGATVEASSVCEPRRIQTLPRVQVRCLDATQSFGRDEQPQSDLVVNESSCRRGTLCGATARHTAA